MDLSTIHQRLEQGPSDIETAANAVVVAKRALDEAKKQVERAKASVTIREGSAAKNQSILNALVVMDPDVDQAEAAVIQKNADYLMAVARHERQKDEFDAVRKQANLLETSIRSGIHG